MGGRRRRRTRDEDRRVASKLKSDTTGEQPNLQINVRNYRVSVYAVTRLRVRPCCELWSVASKQLAGSIIPRQSFACFYMQIKQPECIPTLKL